MIIGQTDDSCTICLTIVFDPFCIGMPLDITAKIQCLIITIISRRSAEKAVFRAIEPHTPLPYREHIDLCILQRLDDTVIRRDDGIIRDWNTGAFSVSLIDIDQLDTVPATVFLDLFIQ